MCSPWSTPPVATREWRRRLPWRASCRLAWCRLIRPPFAPTAEDLEPARRCAMGGGLQRRLPALSTADREPRQGSGGGGQTRSAGLPTIEPALPRTRLAVFGSAIVDVTEQERRQKVQRPVETMVARDGIEPPTPAFSGMSDQQLRSTATENTRLARRRFGPRLDLGAVSGDLGPWLDLVIEASCGRKEFGTTSAFARTRAVAPAFENSSWHEEFWFPIQEDALHPHRGSEGR